MNRFLKPIIILVAVFSLLLSAELIFAGGKSEKAETKKTIVALATDVGGLGDKSFNDGSYAGLQQAADEFGLEARVVESKQQTDYIPNLSGLAEDGAKVVFAVGFLMAEAIVEAANNNPDTHFGAGCAVHGRYSVLVFAAFDVWNHVRRRPTATLRIRRVRDGDVVARCAALPFFDLSPFFRRVLGPRRWRSRRPR